MNALNMSARIPVLFRTYESPNETSILCKVWEAARATSAAPTFFKRIEIGPRNRAEPFIDGGLGRNNPTAQVLEEAEGVYPTEKIACIVSIGTGRANVIDMPNPNFFQRTLVPIGVINAVVAIATDCEEAAQQMEKRFKYWPNVYFRFNVEQGLQKVKLGDWDKMGEVAALTKHYMCSQEVDKKLSMAVQALRERRGQINTLQLSSYWKINFRQFFIEKVFTAAIPIADLGPSRPAQADVDIP